MIVLEFENMGGTSFGGGMDIITMILKQVSINGYAFGNINGLSFGGIFKQVSINVYANEWPEFWWGYGYYYWDSSRGILKGTFDYFHGSAVFPSDEGIPYAPEVRVELQLPWHKGEFDR